MRLNVHNLVWISSVGWFLYCVLCQRQRWLDGLDDTNVMCFLVPAVICCTVYTAQCSLRIILYELRKFFADIVSSGWVRCSVFVIFVCLFSYVLVVVVLDGSWVTARYKIQDVLVNRLEKNIIDVEEKRAFHQREFEKKMNRRTKQDPGYEISDQQYYYRGEDGTLSCSEWFVWDSISPIPHDLISVKWKFNGKPVNTSGRFVQRDCIAELPKNESTVTRDAWEYGLIVYNINHYLTIRMIEPGDFGIYTCELLDFTEFWMGKWALFVWNVTSFMRKNVLAAKDAEELTMMNSLKVFPYLSPAITRRNLLLLEAERKPITITASPGALLSFQTTYWQQENEIDEIQAELFINNKPYHHIGSMWDCSFFLLLYWMSSNEDCGLFDPFCMPPFQRNYESIHSPCSAKIPKFTVCLGEESFGHYQVEYHRQHFNATTRKFELVSVYHPHDLIVLPRKQELFSMVLTNYTPPPPDSFLDLLPDKIPTQTEMYFIKDAASARTSEFQSLENFLLAVTVIFVILISVVAMDGIRYVAWCAKRRIFSDFFVNRTTKSVNSHQALQQVQGSVDIKRKFSRMKFDLFVSYSDTEIDLANEDILPFLEHNLGQVVCSRERDIPPNLHEISALDTAMRNSQRYIIFLSPDYLQDRLRKNIEAKGIVDLVGSSHARPKDSLLVVKVAQCRIPTWLSAFSLHDWTTHLSREDHLRRLSQWVIPVSRRPLGQECRDVFMRGLPLWLMLLALLCLGVFLYV